MTDETQEKIIAAAMQLPEHNCELWLPPPARHDDVSAHARRLLRLIQIPRNMQGFRTSKGRFVDRMEAAKIAIAADQILPRREIRFRGEVLTTEDVW